MRAVVQRVRSARVTVGERTAGAIAQGVVVLLGVEAADTAADGAWLAQKIANLRIFDDADGRMNRSLLDLASAAPAGAPDGPAPARSPLPSLLVVSQFTLLASTQKGTRPSFNRAARPEVARPLYEQFLAQCTAALGRAPATGEFGAMMQVELANDGPMTLVIDSKLRE
ncbi:MAG TPA: D-aminoacyl-tRNA deacylase [Opitutaceae bacterium]|nr:D-aminoacyl-tRNA deacylase [Opitutaceae bacterium]